jgi:Mrp family chromosome partitioning ATPase
MGKMMDALHQGRSRRNPAGPGATKLAALWPEEEGEAGAASGEEEMPFIEVGGPHEPGEKVLPVAPPALTLKPQDSPPLLTAPPVVSVDGLMTVRFQPLPVTRMTPTVLAQFAAELIAFHQPDHAISSQYRDLATCLMAQTPMKQPHVLLFTGSAPGTGTTTVLLNTAITLARQNLRRVVVVDAHLRRAAVAGRLGLSEAPGLRDVLNGRLPVEEAVRATSLPGLMALTAGTADGVPSARLAGSAMRSLLKKLQEQYDLVLIDAPHWDGRPEIVALGCACDAVYLCLSETEENAPETAELLQVIPEQGAALRGCILTSR